MRLPAVGGTGDGGHCCRCVVPGALLSPECYDLWTGLGMTRALIGQGRLLDKGHEQQILSWHIPLCHRHMVRATTHSSLF
jgi:hypothetical protein